jgi:GT2 family glycosyltransferase
MTSPLPISVVVPTIGRSALLRQCLRSVAACRPLPAEIVVSDQSPGGTEKALVAEFAGVGARWVHCDGRGIGHNTNRGMAAARHDTVLVTHDDCTVDPDWVGRAWDHLSNVPEAIVTGQVRPLGDPLRTPTTKTDPEPTDYTGRRLWGVLYAANMAFDRRGVQALGGFDERPTLALAGEDNDLCYRWLRAGGSLRYQPDMVVWHHDWREPAEMDRTYLTYGRAHGAFYAKHLYEGDLQILRFLWWSTRDVARSLAEARRGRERWTDARRGLFPGIPIGMVAGWRECRRLARDSADTVE